MRANCLVVTTEATHRSLQQRLDEATRRMPGMRTREGFARTDAFMAATSRHVAAVEDVLLKVASRRVPDGARAVHEYLHQARALEHALARLKARLYGELHMADVPWPEVWNGVRKELTRHNELELRLVTALAEELDEPESDALAVRLYHAEVRAPTRAHPYIPHSGFPGLVARRLWAVADRFWDTAEGRVLPQVRRPASKEHRHDSLVAQYLVGEPRLDAKAPLVAHRQRRR